MELPPVIRRRNHRRREEPPRLRRSSSRRTGSGVFFEKPCRDVLLPAMKVLPDVQAEHSSAISGEKVSARFSRASVSGRQAPWLPYDLARDVGQRELLGSAASLRIPTSQRPRQDRALRRDVRVDRRKCQSRGPGAATTRSRMTRIRASAWPAIIRRGGSVGETAEGVRELPQMFQRVTRSRPVLPANPRLRHAYVHY